MHVALLLKSKALVTMMEQSIAVVVDERLCHSKNNVHCR